MPSGGARGLETGRMRVPRWAAVDETIYYRLQELGRRRIAKRVVVVSQGSAFSISLHCASEGDNEGTMSAEQRLKDLGIELPPPPKPAGVYKPIVIVGNQVLVSGHGPLCADGSLITGKVGQDKDLEGGYAAARQTGLAILATLRKELGSLDRIKRVVKLLGMVNATPDFVKHPAVINGCSELYAQVFGADAGVGVRSAVGMGSLPGNISVEIEGVFELNN